MLAIYYQSMLADPYTCWTAHSDNTTEFNSSCSLHQPTVFIPTLTDACLTSFCFYLYYSSAVMNQMYPDADQRLKKARAFFFII